MGDRRPPGAALVAFAAAIGYRCPVLDLAHRLAERLTPWFDRHQRDLEWRRTRDPYAIWVSEIMLQQTRVDTVRAYYRAFMERFPDVGALATADEESVLQAWSGLGYYRRARLLHAGAGYVARELGGRVPDTGEGLRKIPGVGRYTAGAIASIAFDKPVPLVDGNVARVRSRILALGEPSEQEATASGHWGWVEKVLAAGSPRILAQALMELGATVCTPTSPRCDACPVRDLCQANAQGLTATIPAPRRKAAQTEHALWALAIARGDRILVERRPSAGLLAGLWCLPLIERGADDPRPAAVEAATGVAVTSLEPIGDPVRHVFTHRIWTLYPCRAQALGEPKDRDGALWIAAGERPAGGIPKVTEKVLARLGY